MQENIMLVLQEEYETEEEKESRYEAELEEIDRDYEDRVFDEIIEEEK